VKRKFHAPFCSRGWGREAPAYCTIIRPAQAALSRTGTVCEFEVPLGVGNNLCLEVTLRCNTEKKNSPPDRAGCTVIIPGIPLPGEYVIRGEK
jgi:hypothetical protein